MLYDGRIPVKCVLPLTSQPWSGSGSSMQCLGRDNIHIYIYVAPKRSDRMTMNLTCILVKKCYNDSKTIVLKCYPSLTLKKKNNSRVICSIDEYF